MRTRPAPRARWTPSRSSRTDSPGPTRARARALRAACPPRASRGWCRRGQRVDSRLRPRSPRDRRTGPH
ncbi:MAG: hypothetical protein AMS19_09450 [Gemmatimonas sp. SG8_23]|nr:MAG: hypothetical protein AMS19_09450 [Gemmatimonas sp. SG8_23]